MANLEAYTTCQTKTKKCIFHSSLFMNKSWKLLSCPKDVKIVPRKDLPGNSPLFMNILIAERGRGVARAPWAAFRSACLSSHRRTRSSNCCRPGGRSREHRTSVDLRRLGTCYHPGTASLALELEPADDALVPVRVRCRRCVSHAAGAAGAAYYHQIIKRREAKRPPPPCQP